MDAFMNAETNPIMRILAQESDIDYMDKAVAFFFALSIVKASKGNYLSRFAKSLINMYGATAFVIPMLLGGLPSDLMKGMDDCCIMIFSAMVFDWINPGQFSGVLADMINWSCKISYAIMKANMCAAGYSAFGDSFKGSVMAPFLGAFLAVSGHEFINKGVGAFDVKLRGSNDNKLACLGGLVIMACSTPQVGFSAMVTRATLAGMNVAQATPYVSFDKVVDAGNNMVTQVTGSLKLGSGARKMKARGRSPARK